MDLPFVDAEMRGYRATEALLGENGLGLLGGLRFDMRFLLACRGASIHNGNSQYLTACNRVSYLNCCDCGLARAVSRAGPVYIVSISYNIVNIVYVRATRRVKVPLPMSDMVYFGVYFSRTKTE